MQADLDGLRVGDDAFTADFVRPPVPQLAAHASNISTRDRIELYHSNMLMRWG